jgi:hypothetical protein
VGRGKESQRLRSRNTNWAWRGFVLNSAKFRDQLAGGGIFGDESVGAGREGFFHEAAGAVLGKEDDLDVREFVFDQAGGFEAADDRHRNVHENEVGLVLFGEADGISSVGGFADDFDIGVGLKNFADRSSDDVAVVHYENTQRRCLRYSVFRKAGFRGHSIAPQEPKYRLGY